jgi:hypothetical protein
MLRIAGMNLDNREAQKTYDFRVKSERELF